MMMKKNEEKLSRTGQVDVMEDEGGEKTKRDSRCHHFAQREAYHLLSISKNVRVVVEGRRRRWRKRGQRSDTKKNK